MASREQYITPEGALEMRDELERLIQIERPEISKRLRAAIQMGDLKENADYHAAKEQQAFLEGRILELQETLRNATIIEVDISDISVVRVGHTVTIQEEDTDTEETYRLVGATEANPREGRISNESPIGQALLGKSVGDLAQAETPGGSITFEILRIEPG